MALNIVMLSVYAEFHILAYYAACCYAECRYAECRGTSIFISQKRSKNSRKEKEKTEKAIFVTFLISGPGT
jgi:hypothetical protein